MKTFICEKPFLSIQGEGNYAGIPAVFVRFSGCTLKCPDCDTKYHQEGFEIDTDEIVKQILELNPLTKSVVFTGGEPLLQQEAIADIINKLQPSFRPRHGSLNYKFWWFQIETNSTVSPQLLCREVTNSLIQFNVSPKLSEFNSQEEAKNLFDQWYIQPHDFILKFVTQGPEDIEEIKKIATQFRVNPEQIYLMPEGKRLNDQLSHMELISELAIKNGYNFTPRLHVLIWGDRKGV